MNVSSLARRVAARLRTPRGGSPPLAILLYHGVVRRRLEVADFCFITDEELRRQLDVLRRRFRIVSLEEGVRLLDAGELDEPTAVITFDDGFENNLEVALPALREAGAPATIFVCTDLLDSARVPWYCRLHDAITRTARRELEWDGARWSLEGNAARKAAADRLKNGLKRLPQSELEAAVDEIARRLDADAGAPDPRFRMLTRAAMREMARGGLIDFGAHTGSHAILSRLTAAEKSSEIERSVSEVSAITGAPCRTFAYPNGRFEDYDGASLDLLRRAGVTVAVTAEKGWNDARTPRLELLRFAIGGEPSMPLFDQVVKRYEKTLRSRP